MGAREHFEAAAQALAAAEAPGVAPELRDEHLRSMRNHESLARLVDHLDWSDRQAAVPVPAASAIPAALAPAPAAQPASTNPQSWVVRNRRELLHLVGGLIYSFALVGSGLVMGLLMTGAPR